VNILLADGADALAERVVQAIREPGLRERVRAQGRRLVTTDHDPERLAGRYKDAVGGALGESVARDRPLSAVIDLRWMRPGVAGGIENLSRSFVDPLLRLDRYNRYRILVPTEVRYDFDARGADNVRFVRGDGIAASARVAALTALRLLH